MEFQPNKIIQQNIKDKNIENLRATLTVIIRYNKSFKNGEFDNSLKYIEEQGINIYEPFDGKELFGNKNELNDNDFMEAFFSLENNFCRERIKDVRKIGEKLYSEVYDRNRNIESNINKDNSQIDNFKNPTKKKLQNSRENSPDLPGGYSKKSAGSSKQIDRKLIYAIIGVVVVIIIVLVVS